MPTSKAKPGPGHSTTSLSNVLGGAQNHCFGCGPANRHGLRLRFALDAEAGTATARFRLTRRFEGPPGHIHGGIIATLLDEAMGKVNKLKDVVALTRHIEVDYLRPVPLRQSLVVVGSAARVEGRKHTNRAEIRDANGDLLARATGLFIAIDPVAMFAKLARTGGRKPPPADG